MDNAVEVKELRDELIPRLDRIDTRVTKLETFKIVAVTVVTIVLIVAGNAAAWIGVAG